MTRHQFVSAFISLQMIHSITSIVYSALQRPLRLVIDNIPVSANCVAREAIKFACRPSRLAPSHIRERSSVA
jgi:hypothetical protein